MLTTLEEIKSELKREIGHTFNNDMPSESELDRLLNETADGYVPVYNVDIMKEWVALPGEHSDRWKDLGYDTQRNEGGIISLMQLDLVIYYLELTQKAWDELLPELEEEWGED